MAVLSDKKISIKEYEKISKYNDLETEKKQSLKTTVKPIIIVTIDRIKNGTNKNITNIPGSSVSLCGTAQQRKYINTVYVKYHLTSGFI